LILLFVQILVDIIVILSYLFDFGGNSIDLRAKKSVWTFVND